MNRATAAVAIALVATAVATGGTAAQEAPKLVVRSTVDDVIAVLRDSSLSTDQRKSRIESIAYERFDMQTMSKLVLARSWKKLSPEQQGQYVEEFKQYLANYYGGRIDQYSQEKVEILDARTEKRGDVTVMTRIVGGQYENATVDYRMRNSGGSWLVIDVIVEGISLVSNYRDQFREVMSRGGPEKLLEQLRQKNASGGDFGEDKEG